MTNKQSSFIDLNAKAWIKYGQFQFLVHCSSTTDELGTRINQIMPTFKTCFQ